MIASLLLGRPTKQLARASFQYRTPVGPNIFFPRLEAGIAVNQMTALRLSTLWRCVVVLSDTLAWLPCRVEKRLPKGGWEIDEDNPVDWLFFHQANPGTNAFDFKSTLFHHAVTWGNGYARIERDRRGEPKWLWQVTPDKVRVRVDGPEDLAGGIYYEISNGDLGDTDIVQPDNMIHIKGLSFDGVIGLSQVHVAARAVGLGLATEQYGAAFFENSARPSGLLKYPNELKDPQRKTFLDYWKAVTGGSRSQSTPFLEHGIEYQAIGLTNEEAQFIATRDYQCLEICRLMGVPPHKIFKLDNAHLKNVEQQDREWYTGTLRAWMSRLECEAHSKLFGLQRQGRTRLRFQPRELLRGDIQTQTQADNMDLRAGIYSIDQILERRGDAPSGQKGGDARLIEGQRIPLERLVEDPQRMPPDPAPPTEPMKPEQPDGSSEESEDEELRPFIEPMARTLRRLGYLKRDAVEYIGGHVQSLARPFERPIADFAGKRGFKKFDAGTIAANILRNNAQSISNQLNEHGPEGCDHMPQWFVNRVLEVLSDATNNHSQDAG